MFGSLPTTCFHGGRTASKNGVSANGPAEEWGKEQCGSSCSVLRLVGIWSNINLPAREGRKRASKRFG